MLLRHCKSTLCNWNKICERAIYSEILGYRFETPCLNWLCCTYCIVLFEYMQGGGWLWCFYRENQYATGAHCENTEHMIDF